MVIICQETATISGSNSIICGKTIRISNIQDWINYNKIDVYLIDRELLGIGDYTFTLGTEQIRVQLVSKNVSAGTAVVTLTISGEAVKIQKELVTNLTSNETIVKAAVILVETTNATYVSKYQEGQNWVFVFEFDREPAYVELGAGATFAKFVAKNWATIAAVLVGLGVVAIVWLWRDAVTAVPEAQAQISANDTQSLAEILNNPTLTPEQKTSLVETVLKKTYGDLTGADSGSYILYGIGILAAAYIIGEMMKGRR